MSFPPADPAISVPALRASLKGQVLAPADDAYDEARTVYYRGVDRHPAVIVQPAEASDVQRVVTLARERGLELAIRGGGHSPAAHGVCEGGIVLDLRSMKALEIDAAGRTAWAEAGLTAGEVTTAAGADGLAIGFGDTASVGVAGITLAGGLGYLTRKHGLTIDDLLAAEIVTADGALLHTDADRHPDLFWAIRGGGGNFGVATRLKFRLHPVDQVIGGLLMWPATPELVAALLAAADAAPQELSGMVNVLPAPPLPLVPSEYHGKLVAVVPLCHADGGEAGERAVAAFRAIAKPVVDLVRPMRYPELYQVAERPKPVLEASRTLFLDAVDQRTAEVVVDRLRAASSPLVSAQLRVLGGAMARVPVEATAFAHRQRRLMVGVGASYERPEEAPIRQQWADDLAAALRQLEPASVPGAYPGFMADEGEARIREAYPGPTWDRLRAVKRRYDPTNLFRRNQNIPPATA